MLKSMWHKIKQNHLLLMVVCCLIPVVAIAGGIFLLKGGSEYWVWFILLLYPLLHVWMMKGHEHGNKTNKKRHEVNKQL